jgi:hypothetical protein
MWAHGYGTDAADIRPEREGIPGGNGIFAKNIFMAFLNSPHRETPKNVLKKKTKKVGWWVGGSGI